MHDLPLARFTIDRAAQLRSNPLWFEQAWAADTTRVLVLHERKIPVTTELSIVWVKPWSLKMSENDAKDAVQQVFIKVIHELSKYKVTYFKSWLYMVGKNHCLLEIRGRKKSHYEINDNLLAADANDLNMQVLLQKEQTLNLLEKSITILNEEQKQCITLFYLQKKSYLEITTTTGYTLMQVKSHIQNGKRNLKIMLEKQIENGE